MTLSNKNIIITSPKNSSEKFQKLLETEHANIVELPLIKIQQSEVSEEVRSAFENLTQFNWLVFTSKNGVQYFFEFLSDKLPKNLKIAVIGKSTAKAVIVHGYQPDFISKGRTSSDFLLELKEIVQSQNESFLLILGNLAPNVLQNGLKGKAKVERINVYETVAEEIQDQTIIEKVKRADYDWMFFTSPSAFKSLLDLGIKPDATKLVSIGPTTTAAMQALGYYPAITASQSNIETMVSDLIKYIQSTQIL